jgi:hypothetical protein
MVKCPKKINKECECTGSECNHSVKHKRTRWCYTDHCSCPSCVEVETVGKVVAEELKTGKFK